MEIKLYLSKQGFDKKPDKASGMIKTVKSYDLVNIDIEKLYKKLANGHFIHPECGFSLADNGSKCYTFKKSKLVQTQLMQIDFDFKLKDTKNNGEVIEKQYAEDEMPVWTEELLSNLKYKNSLGNEIDVSPTFWMESFSAHKHTDTKIIGNNVHLFYIFKDPIYSAADFEKVAVSLIYAVNKALKEKGYNIPLEKERCPFDPVSTDMFQGIWGSYNKAHHFNGNTYFWAEFKNAYKPELKEELFKVSSEEITEATEEEIRRTIEAYSTVKTIDDIDIKKCQYLKYKNYFGHEETFRIISTLKCIYSIIEENVQNTQSLCYQVCKKLLLGHSNDYFDENENNFTHDYKRCKIYTKKGSNEPAYIDHVIRLIGDTGAIPIIKYKKNGKTIDNQVIELDKTQYLTDKKDEILNMMKYDDETINFIVAAPGLGKTVFAKSLEGNTLIIELFNSVIQSEEKFPSNEFVKFFGSNYIFPSKTKKLNVCSANKFVAWYKNECTSTFNIYNMYNKCLFDNIILDESHLLCMSNYRYDIMGDTVKYLKKLKADYPETNIIIMTGTPFGEETLFPKLNRIEIKAEPRHKKSFHLIQTPSIIGYMKELIKSSLKNKHRIFIPVDSEVWFNAFIDSCVKDGIIAKNKCYYFNQPKNNEDTEKMILNTKLIGDIIILGTSSYMSVGIDLEDWETEFTTIIPSGASASGNFTGQEVEQFANRHRKQNLYVYYVISMNESNNNKPPYISSCRALLNIKNDLLKSIYRTNPIVIKMPKYLIANDNTDALEVHEDMFNCFIYYKDTKPYASHPAVIFEYMHDMGWDSIWEIVEHTEGSLNTKEQKDLEKLVGTNEFMNMLKQWKECNFCTIKVNETVQESYNLIKHESAFSLFDVNNIEVSFSNYYAKNTLFPMLLNLREYLTGEGAYNLIIDNYDNIKINMSSIDRTLKAIKIVNNYSKAGLWAEIYTSLSEFYNKYSTVENGVYKENKKEYERERDAVVQKIWDSLAERIDDDILRLVFECNYNNITEHMIDDFMDGIKLICTMYLQKESTIRKINKKSERVTTYSWDQNALARYEIRKDKKTTL